MTWRAWLFGILISVVLWAALVWLILMLSARQNTGTMPNCFMYCQEQPQQAQAPKPEPEVIYVERPVWVRRK